MNIKELLESLNLDMAKADDVKNKVVPLITNNKTGIKKVALVIGGLALSCFLILYVVSYSNNVKALEQEEVIAQQLEEERLIKEEQELERLKEEVERENVFHKELIPFEAGEMFGYINENFEVVVEPTYSNARKFSEELAAVKVGTKYGYLDKRGKLFINPEYDYAGDFINGYAFVGKNDKYTFIDQMNMPITGYNFDMGDRESKYSGELANVCVGGKHGFINTIGEFIIEPKFDSASSFNSGYALVYKNKIFFYIDKEGNQVGNIAAEDATSFSEGEALIYQNGVVQVINTDFAKTKTSILKMDSLGEFYNGFALVKLNKTRTVFVNSNGEIVKGKNFEAAGKFSEGLAPVKIGGKWGYVNTEFNVVIPPKYSGVTGFTNGSARVYLGDDMYYIDKNGNVFWQS